MRLADLKLTLLAVLFCWVGAEPSVAQSRRTTANGTEIHIDIETARETTQGLTGGKLEIDGGRGRGLNKVFISCKRRQDVVLKDNPDGSFELVGTGVVLRNFDIFVIEDEETRAKKQ